MYVGRQTFLVKFRNSKINIFFGITLITLKLWIEFLEGVIKPHWTQNIGLYHGARGHIGYKQNILSSKPHTTSTGTSIDGQKQRVLFFWDHYIPTA
jgi:hypothetical protein